MVVEYTVARETRYCWLIFHESSHFHVKTILDAKVNIKVRETRCETKPGAIFLGISRNFAMKQRRVDCWPLASYRIPITS